MAFAIITHMCKQCVLGTLSPLPPPRLGTRLWAQGSFEKYSHYVLQEHDQVVPEVGVLEVVFAHVMHMPA